MPTHIQTIAEDRPLIESEKILLRWLLEHGETRGRDFLPQIDRARVSGRCGCGCATVDLAVDGLKEEEKGLFPVADFFYRTPSGGLCGVMAMARGDRLAGLEVWSVDGRETPTELPATGRLFPAAELENGGRTSDQSATPGKCPPSNQSPPPGVAHP
ncbi:MAG: hypothetical protein IPL39_20905 [Opitutaceae bacterium]|nr:hypothetical protein [Opitutaceae bacterium]